MITEDDKIGGDLIIRREAHLQKKEKFLEVYVPEKAIIAFGSINTPDKALAIRKSTMTLSQIKKQFGDEFVLLYIELWIVNVNDYFNFKTKMNEWQRKETALYVYQDYYYLTIPEITLIFTSAKKGKYKELFQSIDGAKIISWFADYDISRCDAIEKEHMDKKREEEKSSELLPKEITDKIMEVINKRERFNEEKFKDYEREYKKKQGKVVKHNKRGSPTKGRKTGKM